MRRAQFYTRELWGKGAGEAEPRGDGSLREIIDNALTMLQGDDPDTGVYWKYPLRSSAKLYAASLSGRCGAPTLQLTARERVRATLSQDFEEWSGFRDQTDPSGVRVPSAPTI